MVYQTRKILVYNSKTMAMGNLIKVDIMPSNDKNMEKTYLQLSQLLQGYVYHYCIDFFLGPIMVGFFFLAALHFLCKLLTNKICESVNNLSTTKIFNCRISSVHSLHNTHIHLESFLLLLMASWTCSSI